MAFRLRAGILDPLQPDGQILAAEPGPPNLDDHAIPKTGQISSALKLTK
jgi:hypothetical protein